MDKSLKNLVNELPRTPGVYLFSDNTGKIIYVGKAINLRERVRSYLNPTDPKTKLMTAQAATVNHINVFSEFEGLLLEASLINKHQPKYNSRLKDDKSFLYIAITNEEFPKVLALRKSDLKTPRYFFGPFPSAKTVRQVLRFLRRIIPYCSQKENRRPCFWSHLGLCSPCPGEISKLRGAERQMARELYLTNIKNLVAVLRGKSKVLSQTLEKEMNEAARKKNFEKAAQIRDQFQKLTYLTTQHFPLNSYLEKNNFFEEEQEKELTELASILNIPNLQRIECYDISNIFGQFATGSMVVFINGIQSSDNYRRFRIKMISQPNDVAMIKEIISRRLKHKEWPYPDLLTVDGGRGQVSAALNVLKQWNINIPVIGLAKRLETVIIPVFRHPEFSSGSSSGEILKQVQNDVSYEEINLPANSPALNLLKRLRDQSHRFALSYHRHLRSKNWQQKA